MGQAADQIREFTLRFKAQSDAHFANVGSAMQASIQDGSPVTGAPGQPVDTGYLRATWTLSFGDEPQFSLNGEGATKDPAWAGAPIAAPLPPDPTARSFIVATNCVYAEVWEDGVKLVGRGNVTGKTKQRLSSSRGGPHSAALTVAAFERLVEDEWRKLSPSEGR